MKQVSLIPLFLLVFASCRERQSSDSKQSENVTTSRSGISNTTAERDLKSAAFVISTNFVKDILETPSTADFGGAFDATEAFKDGDNYVVNHYFDAENVYGAKVRSKYTCKLKFKGGDEIKKENWTCLLLIIDGKELINNLPVIPKITSSKTNVKYKIIQQDEYGVVDVVIQDKTSKENIRSVIRDICLQKNTDRLSIGFWKSENYFRQTKGNGAMVAHYWATKEVDGSDVYITTFADDSQLDSPGSKL